MKKIIASEYNANDGWDLNLDEMDTLLYVCNRVDKLTYELEHCVKGAYSKCDTYTELADFVIKLGRQLESIGEVLQSQASYYDDFEGLS